jgi:hypothetical protein
MNEGRIRKSFIYRHLASIKTSVYLLFILFIFFLIGTIFPQGVELERYREAGGRFIFAAKYLGLLNIFETPLFLISGLLLVVNTLLCTIERVIALSRKKAEAGHFSRKGQKSYRITEDTDIPALQEDLKVGLVKRGFRFLREDKTGTGRSITFGRGINLAVTSILFHAGILVCILLFFATHYFAYENYLTLYPGETKEVVLPGGKVAPFQLKLNGFSTTYEDNPKIEFPEQAHLKIAVLLQKPGEGATFKLPEGAIAVSDWVSDLSVLQGDREMARENIEVNVPLRYRGLTFYQMGYDQEVELIIRGKKERISPGKPIPGKKGENLTISNVKHGTLTRLDGKKEKIKPYLSLYRLKEGENKKSREKIADLTMGESGKIDGVAFTFSRFKEASVLSYRVDPSVNVLYYLSFFVVTLVAARLYLRRSRLKVEFIPGEGGVVVVANLRAEGAIYSPRGEKRKVMDAMEETGLVEIDQS